MQEFSAMAQVVSRRPVTMTPGFAPGPVHLGFVMDRVTLGQISVGVLLVSLCPYHSTVALRASVSPGE
jgi:hypothetical protein